MNKKTNMKQKHFRCTFLSDIVLNADSASGGVNRSLDYIPGSVFLGITAKNYQDFQKKNLAFKVFHSGLVHFGDAHPSKNKSRSFRVPFSWYKEKYKNKSDKEIIQYHLKSEDEKRQMKQIRSGFYFEDEKTSENIKECQPKHRYSMKSAHNKEQGCSQEGKMYGYDAIAKGSEWIFSIKVPESDSSILREISDKLIGEKQIGKSRSSQYGLVKIEELPDYLPAYHTKSEPVKNEKKESIIYLYFDSNAAFFDEYFQPCFRPSTEDLKLSSDCLIRWDQSQIRIRAYAPWNGKRKNRDFDRSCIEKGSVIAVQVPENFDIESYRKEIESGVGYYKNEGFGQIIVQPDFLTFKQLSINKQESLNYDDFQYVLEQADGDQSMIDLIKKRGKNIESEWKIYKEIKEFIDQNFSKFKKISNSQWGSIRRLAQESKDYDDFMDRLFKENEGYLMHGKAESKWENCKDQLKDKLKFMKKEEKKDSYIFRFVVGLCSEMAKMNEKEGGKDEK